MAGEVVGIASPNARIVHIRKLACNPPKRGHLLRLVTTDTPPLQLGEWAKDEARDNGALAQEIEAMIEDHALSKEEDVSALLAWVADDGSVVQGRQLNVRLSSLQQASDIESAAAALGVTGKAEGLVMQSQRFCEIMVRLCATTIQSNVNSAASQSERMAATNRTLHEENEALRRERDELKSRVLELEHEHVDTPEDEAKRAEAAAKVQLFDAAGKMLNLAGPQIMQGIFAKKPA